MGKVEFSPIRYSADRGSGERLNVGLILFDREARQLKCLFPDRLDRVNHTFGEKTKPLKSSLKEIGRLAESLSYNNLYGGSTEVSDLRGFLSIALPDRGLGLFWDEVMVFDSNEDSDIDSLYQIYVGKYFTCRPSKRRDDEAVWDRFFSYARKHNISSAFTEHSFGSDFDFLQVKHAAKNGKWHVIEPVSLDYEEKLGVCDRRDRMNGRLSMLNRSAEIGSVTVLVGDSKNADKDSWRNIFVKGLQTEERKKVTIRVEDESEQVALEFRRILTHS
jgi:hypothetical protein